MEFKIGQRVVCTYPSEIWEGLVGTVREVGHQVYIVGFTKEDNPGISDRAIMVSGVMSGGFTSNQLRALVTDPLQQAALDYCHRELSQ